METLYLERVFNPESFQLTIKSMVQNVSRVFEETPFEALAFMGQSGAAIAYPLSYLLQMPLILVRKDDDSSHHVKLRRIDRLRYLEGEVHANTFLIVDDQIESGASILKIIERIRDYNPNARCVGVMLFGNNYARETLSPNNSRMFMDQKDTFPVYFGGYG